MRASPLINGAAMHQNNPELPLRCLRRTEPSAALIPHPGQQTLAYVPAAQSDIRQRIHEFNRRESSTGGR
jgi:hypothetical protein